MKRFTHAAAFGAAFLLTMLNAANAADNAKDFAGPYRLATQDGKHVCTVQLDAKPAGKGFGITIGKDCNDAFALQSVQAWKPYNGMIVFLSDTGTPVSTFEESEAGLYVSDGGPGPAYTLRNEAGNAPRLSQANVRMAGQWTLGATSGPAMCTLLFSAAEADTGGVRASDPCRNEWRAKNFFTWRVADHRLTLLDVAGHVIRSYIQRDPNTFQDEADLETPIFLWRPVK